MRSVIEIGVVISVLIVSGCTTAVEGQPPFRAAKLSLQELYDKKQNHFNRLVSVQGRLTMSTTSHVGDTLSLRDLEDPSAGTGFYMTEEEVSRFWEDRKAAIEAYKEKNGPGPHYFPHLTIDVLSPIYDLRGDAVAVPEAYEAEILLTKVLRRMQNQCVTVVGMLVDRSYDWHSSQSKYVGVILPISMEHCDEDSQV